MPQDRLNRLSGAYLRHQIGVHLEFELCHSTPFNAILVDVSTHIQKRIRIC